MNENSIKASLWLNTRIKKSKIEHMISSSIQITWRNWKYSNLYLPRIKKFADLVTVAMKLKVLIICKALYDRRPGYLSDQLQYVPMSLDWIL